MTGGCLIFPILKTISPIGTLGVLKASLQLILQTSLNECNLELPVYRLIGQNIWTFLQELIPDILERKDRHILEGIL